MKNVIRVEQAKGSDRWFVSALALSTMIWATGCTTHKIDTRHEVEPIHITVDVNLKIDKALDAYFEEVDNAEGDSESAEE